MSKKKIQALVLAGVLTVSVVGGTFAWYNSKDTVTNVFNTGSTENPGDLSSGIKVVEYFKDGVKDENGDFVYRDPVTPGQTLTKQAWVESRADYDQIIKARVIKNFKDKDGNIITHYKVTGDTVEYDNKDNGVGWKPLDLSNIIINYNDDEEFLGAGWTIQTGAFADANSVQGNYYYYNDVIQEKGVDYDHTSSLIKSVTLSKDANNIYRNLRFDVKVEAESIQATNGAVKDAWPDAPQNILDLDR